jgi:hypothetical protein
VGVGHGITGTKEDQKRAQLDKIRNTKMGEELVIGNTIQDTATYKRWEDHVDRTGGDKWSKRPQDEDQEDDAGTGNKLPKLNLHL